MGYSNLLSYLLMIPNLIQQLTIGMKSLARADEFLSSDDISNGHLSQEAQTSAPPIDIE